MLSRKVECGSPALPAGQASVARTALLVSTSPAALPVRPKGLPENVLCETNLPCQRLLVAGQRIYWSL